MATSTFSKVQDLIGKLSFHELIELLDYLSQEIRRAAEMQKHLEEDVIAMAFDSEIQREFEVIEEEFLLTIVDGLEA
jgi:hypothetical protein